MMKLVSLLLFVLLLASCGRDEPIIDDNVDEANSNIDLDITAQFEDAPDMIINGDFETGDLQGWTSYGLAFNVTGVTSDTTYWNENYDFNHHGHYHFYGHYSAPDRMTGSMHSNVFQVRTEGEVSFMMGAARNGDLLYVALVDVVTEEEVERVTNVNFSDPDNANNFHRYTIDLDDYVGQYVYIKVVDNDDLGEGFGFINVDDFQVIYE